MIISQHCLIGDSVSYKADEILEPLKNDELRSAPWFAVTNAPDTGENLFILSHFELKNKIYPKEKMRLLALAGSKKEAMELVLAMIQQAVDQNRIFDLKQFFEEY